jgi:acyl-homoserine lactone synthase
MIELISGVLPGEHPLLEQAFRLRHSVFVEERGWELLRRPDGREIDQFDDADAVHELALHEGVVVGYHRMRPTTEPHLLADVHRHLCERPYPRSPLVWEWTRYCVRRDRRGGSVLGGVGSELLFGAVEWCLDRGVQDVVLEYHPGWIAYFMTLGFKVRPLGLPTEIDSEPIIAVQMHFDERALAQIRESCSNYKPELADGLRRERAAMPTKRKAGVRS